MACQPYVYVPGSINSHYFHIVGNPIVGVYIPIIRIPIKGGKTTIPNDQGVFLNPGPATQPVVAGLWLDERDPVMARAVTNVGRAQVFTIGGFCFFPWKSKTIKQIVPWNC